MLALQIGAGIWIGFVLCAVTVAAAVEMHKRVELQHRYGHRWWRAFIIAGGRR